MHAGKDFHQGALAGAVLAHQRVHFAALQIEVDVVERRYAGKGLGDAFRRKHDLPGRRAGPAHARPYGGSGPRPDHPLLRARRSVSPSG